MNNKMVKKIELLFASNIDVINDIIFQDLDGSYMLFNRYKISVMDNGQIVVNTFSENLYFNKLKNAVAWCVFEKRNKWDTANRIKELDFKMGSLETSISQSVKLIKKTKDLEYKLIYSAKLSNDQYKRKSIIQELEKYVLDSKYWQSNRYKIKTTQI
jgi:hypothetical protein